MATLKFFTRTNTKKKMVPIRCRLRDGRNINSYAMTGLKTVPEHWSNITQTVKNIVEATYKDEVNKKLRNLKSHILDEYTKMTKKPENDWLQTTIEKYHNPDKYEPKVKGFFPYIQDYIDKAPTRINPKTGRPVCYKQIREYERTFYYLKAFAKEKKREIDFQDIDLDFYHEFTEYLQSLKLATNTIGKKIQTLKIFLNAASDSGLNTNKHYKSPRFTAIKEESESIYLNDDDLRKIFELDLSENKSLDRVRDLFLVGCWTGLRFSDISQVIPEAIKDGFISIKQSKTGGKVIIPVHPTVKAILSKYDGILPPVISNQKFNVALKTIARKAGLNAKIHIGITKGGKRISTSYQKHELVTTHTGRRSFATNLYNAGLPSLSIMAITGHKTEAAFLKYIKVTPREHAEKLKEFWASRPQMKIV